VNDQAAPFQPGREPTAIPFRSRSMFAGYKAFGSGNGAVLMDIELERRLRSVAESATQERRVAGGLLFGAGWTDEHGGYVVIEGFIEAGPGAASGARIGADGADQFTLSGAGLRLLRDDAARLYPGSLEVGWWRTRAVLGEFTPRDFMTQAELVGPDGVGLLVYGSGVHWGTAYLGPDGHAPDTAGTLVTATEAFIELAPEQEPAAEPGPELVDITAGEHLAEDPIPLADDVRAVRRRGLTDAGAGRPLREQAKEQSSRRPRRRAAAPAGRRTPASPASAGPAGRRAPAADQRRATRAWASGWRQAWARPQALPEGVPLVVAALAVVAVVAAVIIGVLLHSTAATLIIAAIVLVVIFSSVWMSRL
jgi:hypothetical protein